MNKTKIIIISELFSLYASLIMGVLSYIPYNESYFLKIASYIGLIKCFNLINCSKYDIMHHLVSFILAAILLSSKDLENEMDINELRVAIQVNISTIFLIWLYYNKNVIIKILFIFTFAYYRFKFNYQFIKGFTINEFICTDNRIISYKYCFPFLNVSYFSLFLLNIIWFYFIVRKLLKDKVVLNFIKNEIKYSSSFLFAIPFYLSYNLITNYQKISILMMIFGSLLCHRYQNITIFKKIDYFMIINAISSSYFSSYISILLSVIFFRNEIFLRNYFKSNVLVIFYLATLSDKLNLILASSLCKLGWDDSCLKDKWTIINTYLWHLGVTIIIGYNIKYGKILI
jgi:hypothetical protein